MLIEAIQALYEHNRIGTEIVLDTAEKLTKEQWLADQSAGRGSIRDTLVHLTSGMRGWLASWEGKPNPGQPDPVDYADVAAVRAFFRSVDVASQSYLKGLTDPDLGRVVTRTRQDGSTMSAPLWQMMLHVTNHGMQHRSEVAAMLTAFGQSPGELDLIRLVPPRV